MRGFKITQSITNHDEVLDKYFEDIKSMDGTTPLTCEEEVDLTKKIKNGDKHAADKLCKANLRFVITVAKKYQGRGMELKDLINEGNLGLIRAAERFDETRGFKFTSYAVWWISQKILAALNDQPKMIRIPHNQNMAMMDIKKISGRFEQEYGRKPSRNEIIILCGQQKNLSASKVTTALDNMPMTTVSFLETPLSNQEDDDGRLLDIMTDENSPSPDKDIDLDFVKNKIKNSILYNLSEEEREVIKLSYGLYLDYELTSYEEIGYRLNLTGEKVKKIKARALQKLRYRLKDLETYYK